MTDIINIFIFTSQVPLKTLIRNKLKYFSFLICLFIPTIVSGVEVCLIPSGCMIDEKGICIDCVEQEFEEETEEEKLEKQIEEEKEREEREKFWKDVNLKIYGSYGNSNFTFKGKNNTSIDRPYVNEVDYKGFSIGTRFSTSPRVSYSLSHFRGTVDSVKINSDDLTNSPITDKVFTTEMSGDLSYTDFTIDYDLVKNNLRTSGWNLFFGVGIFNLNSNLSYQDKSYGSFKYQINEESLLFNSGVDFNFSNNSFLGFGVKVFPGKSYKSNSSDKKITQYSGSDNQPIVELSITNLLVSFGVSF